MSTSDDSTLTRRQAMAMLSAGGLSGMIPTTSAEQNRDADALVEEGVHWATASATASYKHLNSRPQKTFVDKNSDIPFFETTQEDGVHTSNVERLQRQGQESPVPGHRIEAVSNLVLHNVMFVPWVGRWRFTFQCNGHAASYRYNKTEAPVRRREKGQRIAAQAVTIAQPQAQNQNDNMTILASTAKRGTPHALAYPGKNEKKVDEYVVNIGGIRLDEDDIKWAANSLKAVALLISDSTVGRVYSIGKTAKDILFGAFSAYYDDQFHKKDEQLFLEREQTAWTYRDSPTHTAAHSRFFTLDVAPSLEKQPRMGPTVDIRSEFVDKEQYGTWEQNEGIRNKENPDGHSLYQDEVGRMIASNDFRIRLPRLPNPEEFDETQVQEARQEWGLKPYCYVENDEPTNDCIYTATDPTLTTYHL